jgi:hypothetical protein
LIRPSFPITPLPLLSRAHAYKYPSSFAPFSLCFPSSSSLGRCGIARRSTTNLQRTPVDSDRADEPRAPSPLLTFLLHPDAPTDALLLLYLAGKRAPEARRRCASSGRSPPALLETIADTDHAPEFPTPR